MTPWVQGISATTIFTDDLAATKRFYQEVFAVPIIFEDAQSAAFDFGNTVINLLDSSQAAGLIGPGQVARQTDGSRIQTTLTVEDVDAVCAMLVARGVNLINGPMDRPWGIRTACFADPAGHVWEVAQ